MINKKNLYESFRDNILKDLSWRNNYKNMHKIVEYALKALKLKYFFIENYNNTET